MLTTLTRRNLVAAAPVAAVAASLPALATPNHPDAELLALRQVWLKAHDAFYATFEPLAEAERACWPLLREGMSDDEQALVERDTGLTAAKNAQRRACEAEKDIVWLTFGFPATTRDGILFKLELLREFNGCEDEEWEDSLHIDLLRMVGIANV